MEESVDCGSVNIDKKELCIKRGGYQDIFTSYACVYRRRCL